MATYIGSKKLSSSQERSYKSALKSGLRGQEAIKASNKKRETLGSMGVTGEEIARALDSGGSLQIKGSSRELTTKSTGGRTAGSLGITGEEIAREVNAGRSVDTFIDKRVSLRSAPTLGPTTSSLREAQKQAGVSYFTPDKPTTPTRPKSTIEALPKNYKKNQFVTGFKEGFTLFGGNKDAPITEEQLKPSRQLGQVAGGVAFGATIVPMAGFNLFKTGVQTARATKAGQVIGRVATASKGAKTKVADKLVQTFPKTSDLVSRYPRSSLLAGSIGFSETATRTEKLFEDKQTQKITDVALVETRKKIQERGGIGIPGTRKQVSPGSVVSDLTLFAGGESNYGLSSSKSDFIESVQEQTRGLPESERKQILDRALSARTKRGVTEIGTFIGISGMVERTGRKLFTQRLKDKTIPQDKATWDLFKEGFKVVAPLGVVEATVQEKTQQDVRGYGRNWADVAYMGAFGGVSAGVLGGGIVGLAPLNPAKSKALTIGSYIADPYEPLGDISATLFGKAKGRITGRYDSQSFAIVPSVKSEPITFGVSTPSGKRKIKKPSSGIFTPSGSLVSSFTIDPGFFTPDKPTPGKPTPKKPSGVVPTDPIKPSSNIFTPTDTITNIFGGSQTNTFTQTQTNTFTPVTNINIPTATPIMRIPPPFIPSLGLGSGQGAGVGSVLGKTAINELAIGTSILKSLTSTGYNQPKQQTKKKIKTKKPKLTIAQKRDKSLNKIGQTMNKAIWG